MTRTRTKRARPGLPRVFAIFLGSAVVSSVGDGARLAALPLLALSITSDPLAVTALAIANRLPWLAVSLFSGAVADRYDRARLMVAVDLVRAAAVAALAAAVVLRADHLVILYIVAVMLGIGETFYTTAAQALLPDLVSPEDLGRANGRLLTSQMLGSNFVGPVLGSWLFAVSRVLPFALDAVSFLLGSALVSRVAVDRPGTPPRPRTSLLSEVRAGVSWLWAHPLLRSFLLVVTVVNLTQSATQSLLVLLAVHETGMAESDFGWLLAASGLGALAGGATSRWVGERLGVPWVLLPSIALTCPLFLVMATTDRAWLVGAALASNAFLGLLAAVQMTTLRQRLVPKALLGRISSVSMFMSFGFAIPVGALGAGVLASAAGVRTVYVASAVLVLVLVLCVLRDMRPAAVARTIAAHDTGDLRDPSDVHGPSDVRGPSDAHGPSDRGPLGHRRESNT